MKIFIIFTLTCFLVACNSDSSKESQNSTAISFDELNLTGTWEILTETRKVRTDNAAEVSISYRRNTYIFEDTIYGVEYNNCYEYGNFHKGFGVKSDNLFYMSTYDSAEVGFSAVDENQLQRVFTSEDESSPGFTFYETQTLTRISVNPELDNGSFVLNGPVTVAEYDHICLEESYTLLGNIYTVNLNMPFDDDALSIYLRFIGDIKVGSYSYEDYSDTEAVDLDISSNSNVFWDVIGSNTLAPNNVTIDITEVTSSKMVGNFILTGQDEGQYSGEFEVDLYGENTLNNKIIDSFQ